MKSFPLDFFIENKSNYVIGFKIKFYDIKINTSNVLLALSWSTLVYRRTQILMKDNQYYVIEIISQRKHDANKIM